ncbi:Ceramide glucosyltransferase [Smittium mucronatum]|uniref:Ceramide glucosyltransferase n=1 Tax=Smittium mucronatum TaxID=133383 RepID=A0A1R0GWI3_9FUNG|nr:Ceramide glucosyltransferase [Smittium mucronatum]
MSILPIKRMFFWDVDYFDCELRLHQPQPIAAIGSGRLLAELGSMQECLGPRKRILKSSKNPELERINKDNSVGVTIIRPLRGLDDRLEDSLTSSFTQTHSPIQVLFVLQDEKDPSIEIANKVSSNFPNIESSIVIAKRCALNPKVSNMISGFKEAKYDMVWVCDSNVVAESEFLSLALDCFANAPGKVGAVHQMIWASQFNSFGGLLESVFINTTHARMYLALNFSQIGSCLMGKSNVYSISDLEKLGGISSVANYMAEDNVIGQKLWSTGKRHRMTPILAATSVNGLSLFDYWSRRLRWIRTRKYNVTAATLFEPLTECFLNGAIASYSLEYLFNLQPLPVFLTHVIVWFSFDLVFYLRQRAQVSESINRGSFTPLQFLVGWFFRELLALPIWLSAIVGNSVSWRGINYILNTDGTINSFSEL